MPWSRNICISAESTNRGKKLFASFVNSCGQRHMVLTWYHLAGPTLIPSLSDSVTAATKTHSPMCDASISLDDASHAVVKRSIASLVVIGMGVTCFCHSNDWNDISPEQHSLFSGPQCTVVWVSKFVTARTRNLALRRIDKVAGMKQTIRTPVCRLWNQQRPQKLVISTVKVTWVKMCNWNSRSCVAVVAAIFKMSPFS